MPCTVHIYDCIEMTTVYRFGDEIAHIGSAIPSENVSVPPKLKLQSKAVIGHPQMFVKLYNQTALKLNRGTITTFIQKNVVLRILCSLFKIRTSMDGFPSGIRQRRR